MQINYKNILKNVPAEFVDKVNKFKGVAYVKYVQGNTIYAYSPIFKDISIDTIFGTMGCQRGDRISIKLNVKGRFELVENLTLKQEIEEFDRNTIEPVTNIDVLFSYRFLQWREKQLKQKKR